MTKRDTTTTKAPKNEGPGPSVAERAANGRAARARTPRSAHGEFEPSSHRADPVDIIERQSATRIQELVPIRYGRMAEAPFRFYRGAAAIMASDLADTPDSGIRVQLCGDAHMLNFRLLGSPERNLLFDINDFDETLPGPWEWDVKRLATSLVIAGRENGYSDRERADIVRSGVSSYRQQMRRFAKMRNLEVWYARVDETHLQAVAEEALHTRGRRTVSEAVSKARGRDSLQAFEKLTEVVDGRRRFAAVPQLITPLSELLPDQKPEALESQIRNLVGRYGDSLQSDRRHLLEQFTIVDMARKVVGVGSVGTRCWIVLLLGRDGEDPLILQAKEAGESVLAEFAGASEYANEGERVVAGQRLMQAATHRTGRDRPLPVGRTAHHGARRGGNGPGGGTGGAGRERGGADRRAASLARHPRSRRAGRALLHPAHPGGPAGRCTRPGGRHVMTGAGSGTSRPSRLRGRRCPRRGSP
ncbi:DUF2252 domain-containing protein [Streptomyces avidinii]